MEECDSRYTKSAQIATRTMSVNIWVIKRTVHPVHKFRSCYEPIMVITGSARWIS